VSGAAYCEESDAAKTLAEAYPGLTSGALSSARLGDLPADTLLKSEDVTVSRDDMQTEIAGAPANLREQLEKNGLFVLENLATGQLLLALAKGAKGDEGEPSSSGTEKDTIRSYLGKVSLDVRVSDDEVAAFYEENKDLCGGASLEQIKDQLANYVLQQKKQDAVTEYIRTLGQRIPIVVAANWVKEQAKLAMDNPVDKARAGGKPSLVDFGSTGCRPCDMMAPILETLKSKYEGRLNVLFIHVREEQVLASRYGIQSIPVQIFFDKDGKEVFRHTGFYPQFEIEKRLEDMGVK